MAHKSELKQNPMHKAGDNQSQLAGRPSFWIHGAGMSGSTWDALTAAMPLAQTPDLPWHGAAEEITPPTVEAFADYLAEDVKPDTILVGHSLGGMVAMELAVKMPEKVAALILIESVPTASDGFAQKMVAGFARLFVRLTPPKWLARLSSAGQAEEVRAELNKQLSQHTRASLAATMDAAAAYDGRKRLAQIKTPTLIIVASQNKSTHSGALLASQHIPTATLIELSGGHILYVDNPVQMLRAIEDFLASVTSSKL
ncbi:alpha/beta hydrolase [Yoonia sp. GPGPB17]|uniref:alpha/beta fold hydrolase n=1 Tax=Yoonia sp. GPGPB17 TaxID=3026147 RepID=UPI0030BD971F